jgi:tetratricopeptide (TPR) repeat protein
MRFIRGESLEDAIRKFHEADDDPLRDPGERALQLRNLLTRFVAVCNTIEYAHSRGIVHRDIKPENIMLGPYGETLVVDWGLARPIGATETQMAYESVDEVEASSPTIISSVGDRPTQMGAVVGTPQFMSPEQAAGRLDLIGPVSDVYSLGATLYYLLTDQPAFVASDVRKVLRDVQDGRFPPPRQVRRSAPRGLEAVCLRAMALDPARRYPSAKALGDDIEHWLADEPVSVLQETRLERMQRWLRRHKTWARAAAAALIVVAAVAAVAYTREARLRGTVQTALTEEAKARTEADEARKLADRSAALAQTERHRAEGHAQRAERQSVLALDTLKSVLFDIQAKLKNVPAAHAVRLSMLNTVVDGLKQVARTLETSAETDHSLVRAHLDLGDIFLQVGTMDSGRASAEAQAQFERGMEIAKKLHDVDPANSAAKSDLAAAYQRMGDVGLQRGNLSSGTEWFEKSRELRQKLVDERADDAQCRRDLAASIQRLGIVHEQLRDVKAAKMFYLQFFDLAQKLAEQAPQNADDRRNLSVSYERMGDISLLEGDKKAAEDYFQKSLAVRRELTSSKTHGALASRDMSVTLDRLGNLALDRNDL